MTEPTIPLYPVMGCDTCKGVGPLMHTHEGGVIGTNAHLYRCRRCRTVVTLTLDQVLARVNARPPVRIAGSDPAPALAAFANVPADLAQAASDLVPDMQADVEPLPVAPVKLDEPAAAPAAAERLRCLLVLDGVTIGTLYATQAEADVLGEWASRTLARREELEAEIARLRATPARPDQVVDRTYLDQLAAASGHAPDEVPPGWVRSRAPINPLSVVYNYGKAEVRCEPGDDGRWRWWPERTGFECTLEMAPKSMHAAMSLARACTLEELWTLPAAPPAANRYEDGPTGPLAVEAVEKRMRERESATDEAIASACTEPTLLDALSCIAVWEAARIVEMAREFDRTGVSTIGGNAAYNTQFSHCFRRVLAKFATPIVTSDPLHPTGACTCGGEGSCDWCTWREYGELQTDNLKVIERQLEQLRDQLELARIARDEARDALEHGTAKLPPGWAPFEKDSRIIDWLADPERYVYHLGNGLYTAHRRGLRVAVPDGVSDALPMLEAMQLTLGLSSVDELWNAPAAGPCRRMDREPRVCLLRAGHTGDCIVYAADELPPGWRPHGMPDGYEHRSGARVRKMDENAWGAAFAHESYAQTNLVKPDMHGAMAVALRYDSVGELWARQDQRARTETDAALADIVAEMAAAVDESLYFRRRDMKPENVVDDETVMMTSARWRRILAARHALPDGVGGPSPELQELAALRQLHAWGQEEQATRFRLDELGKELAPLAGQLGSFTPKQTDMQVFCLRWINQVVSLDVTVWGGPGGWSNGSCQLGAEPFSLAQQVEHVRAGVEKGLSDRRAAVKASEFAIAQFKQPTTQETKP